MIKVLTRFYVMYNIFLISFFSSCILYGEQCGQEINSNKLYNFATSGDCEELFLEYSLLNRRFKSENESQQIKDLFLIRCTIRKHNERVCEKGKYVPVTDRNID